MAAEGDGDCRSVCSSCCSSRADRRWKSRVNVGLSVLFQLGHCAFLIASLLLQWSRTIVHFDKGIINVPDQVLYPSTFWTNVKNFDKSGARPLAVLLIFGGVGLPILKALAMVALSFESFSLKRARGCFVGILLSQEATGKFTMVASNVGAILLTAVTVTFSLSNITTFLPIEAQAITDTLSGTVLMMLGSVWACFAIGLLREQFNTNLFITREKERCSTAGDISDVDNNGTSGELAARGCGGRGRAAPKFYFVSFHSRPFPFTLGLFSPRVARSHSSFAHLSLVRSFVSQLHRQQL